MHSTRRSLLGISALSALLSVAMACGAPETPGGGQGDAPRVVPDKPSRPVELNILDVAGNLQLTQGMIEEFARANPDIVSGVNFTKATAPEMPGRLRAEQQGGKSQTHLVLTGTDGLSAVIEQQLVLTLQPTYDARLGNLEQQYLPPAAAMHRLARGQGVTITYYPSGPLLEYDPAKVANPPRTARELLDWARANPGRFQYAQPANSGPGRTFLMGLPYILGDKDPKDPVNGWEKTWAYLRELGQYVEYYPKATTDTMKNLANGTVHMIATTTGWDISPRVLGTVPEGMRVGTLEGFHWVTDAHYAVIPKGVPDDVLAANLALVKWMLRPEQQAKAYDKGYFYPGPAVRGVTLDMAPAESRDALARFGRPEYDALIENHPKETSLPAAQQVEAFKMWDREVGSGKGGR